jgi:hypothetical protein
MDTQDERAAKFKLAAGVASAVIGATTTYLYLRQRKRRAIGGSTSPATGQTTPHETREITIGELTWRGVVPLPTDADVRGDLEANWGSTPQELRPLFLFMEEQSEIVGSGRIFSVIAYGESRWQPGAQNGDGNAAVDERERVGSRRAWALLQERNVGLTYGAEAAEFGSGGLFGALAPYFLATGVPTVQERAPLLRSDPRIVFLPRVAAFAACVYLRRLLANYQIDDHADIKVGWGSPSYLSGSQRGGSGYTRIHKKFLQHAHEVGIDLADTLTIPQKLSVERWPGVLEVFKRLVHTLPVKVQGT